MELTKKERNFSKTIECIEDLYVLGDSSLYPLFDRLFFQVDELSRLSESKQDAICPKYNSIQNLFQKHIERLILVYFGSQSQSCQVAFCSDLDTASIDRIDFICELLPQVFNCGSTFNFEKKLAIKINENIITFKGKVNLPQNLEKLRLDCYRLTRTFLNYKVLFTFKSLEADKENLYDIEFRFTIPDELDNVFGIKLSPSKWISFPSFVADFQLSLDALMTMGNHTIYKVDENYQLKTSSMHEIENFSQKDKAVVLHFPFLFRPISLIIPGEGIVVDKSTLSRQSSTGCDEDLENDKGPSWQHIDLLELMRN